MKWDLGILLLAFWNCISIPFDVAYEPYPPPLYVAIENFIDILFACDILVGFRTTYVDTKTGYEVVEGKRIAMVYCVSGRFFVDLAASIPFETVYLWFHEIENENESSLELKLLGLLKLVRLLRLGRIVRYMKFKQGLKVGIRMF